MRPSIRPAAMRQAMRAYNDDYIMSRTTCTLQYLVYPKNGAVGM